LLFLLGARIGGQRESRSHSDNSGRDDRDETLGMHHGLILFTEFM
jgi:hypothetical protein